MNRDTSGFTAKLDPFEPIISKVVEDLNKEQEMNELIFSSWILNQFMLLVIRLLQLGPMPKHVAFIMDGNRRFAKRLKLETFNGHKMGFEQLENV